PSREKGPRVALLDASPRLLDQDVVLHSRRTGRHARHAPQATVEMRDDVLAPRDLPFGQAAHEVDPSARRVHLLAPGHPGGTGGKAETAVDTVIEKRTSRRLCVLSARF